MSHFIEARASTSDNGGVRHFRWAEMTRERVVEGIDRRVKDEVILRADDYFRRK